MELPSCVAYKYKSETNLYDFAKVYSLAQVILMMIRTSIDIFIRNAFFPCGNSNANKWRQKKTLPTSLEFSRDGALFSTMGKDKHIRIFRFLTGFYLPESIAALQTIGKFITNAYSRGHLFVYSKNFSL